MVAGYAPIFPLTQRLCGSLCLLHCDTLAAAHSRRGRTPELDRGSDFISCSSTSKAVRSIRVHPASCCQGCWRRPWWCAGNRVITTITAVALSAFRKLFSKKSFWLKWCWKKINYRIFPHFPCNLGFIPPPPPQKTNKQYSHSCISH